MVSYIAGCLEDDKFLQNTMNRLDLPLFFNFMVNIMQHRSLIVSIPVLHLWSRLLAISKIGRSDFVLSLTPSFLNICTQRLIRWESLPSDSEDPTVQFLTDDIDTLPERHAFVGNYRRYCSSVIETITKNRPQDAVREILGRVDDNLNNLYNGLEPFNSMLISHYHYEVLKLTLILQCQPSTSRQSHSCVRTPSLRSSKLSSRGLTSGLIRTAKHLRMMYGFHIPRRGPNYSQYEQEQERSELEFALENWASNLMQRSFDVRLLPPKLILDMLIINAGPCSQATRHKIGCGYLIPCPGQPSRLCA
jgi:exportin-5